MIDGAAIERELGEDWRVKLPLDPTPAQETEAFAADVEAIHQAHHRVAARRRAALVAWHREQLAGLEATA